MSSRLTVGVLLFGLSAVAVVSQQPGPAAAQAQKKNTVALLQQEVNQLQAVLRLPSCPVHELYESLLSGSAVKVSHREIEK